MKAAVRGEKVQLPSGERLPQVVQEQAPEHLRQHRDRKKVSWPAGDPALSIGRDPAARNQKMNMRMVLKGLPPGVQRTQEADLRAQMLWIGGDLTQRLRRRSEQHIVDNGLVLEGDDLDLLGHREHDVEVGHVEQFGLTVREPLGARETLALWATSTLFAALDVVTSLVKAGHYRRRRRVEFLHFMNRVVVDHPGREIHVILDNLNTHKPKHDRWLGRHKNIHFHFTPTHASWLNQVEVWFSILSSHALAGASFTSPRQVRDQIDAFITAYNQDAHPFEWTKQVVFSKHPRSSYANLRN